jgi:endoglucanase
MNHPTYDQQGAINAKLTKFWTQIATTFKDYDDYLLFAGSNEVGMDNTWGTPQAEWVAVQNSFNQTFVDAVRATGGNNAKRHLVVQGYFTNIDITTVSNTVPTDTIANRLFMEVHYYDPYNFTLNGSSNIWQWGAGATDSTAVETWANEPWVDSQEKMKTASSTRAWRSSWASTAPTRSPSTLAWASTSTTGPSTSRTRAIRAGRCRCGGTPAP